MKIIRKIYMKEDFWRNFDNIWKKTRKLKKFLKKIILEIF